MINSILLPIETCMHEDIHVPEVYMYTQSTH